MNDGRLPGGPTTTQVIEDRKAHRCTMIWQGNVDVDHKTTRLHDQMMRKILLERGGARREKLQLMGFGAMIRYHWLYTDINLCFAVAERFWPRTSSFHLPCGEMAITLEDTGYILGLPVIGKPLVAVACDDYEHLVRHMLGRLPLDDPYHLSKIRGGRIKMKWLIQTFATLPQDANFADVDYYTRAYILALCGCVLFPDSSGTYISLDYLTLLQVLDDQLFNWGGAVLAFSFIVKARMNLTEWRPDMELEKCKRLSLMSNNIIRCVFPSQIRAPLLLTLSLSDNWRLKEIPRDLFTGMKSLLTLDLSYTGIKLLPPSLSCLVNLHTLLLKSCDSLKSVSPIESLEKLEILDLSESRIEELPEELGRLTNLKLLDLSGMEELKTISPKLISNLSLLEELDVTPFCSWEIDETGEGRNASLSEIMSLTRLTSLRIHIKNLECLYMNTIPNHWRNMSRFDILVVTLDFIPLEFDPPKGSLRNLFVQISSSVCVADWVRMGSLRKLALQLSSSVCVADWVRMLLEVTNCLLLLHCDCLESVAQLDPTGLTDGLKLLYVHECGKMRHLLGSSSSSTGVQQKSLKYALRNLEELRIENVENFEAICEGALPDGCLCKLTKLRVEALGNKIRCLIPSDLLQRLQNLQDLRVSSCPMLEMLHPDMSSFSSSSPIFPNLQFLRINDCDKLKYIFPVGVVRHLLQLKSLMVSSCEVMEVIIYDDNDEVVQEEDKMILPQLEELILDGLPSLRCAIPKYIFPNLRSMEIHWCPKLKYIFPMGVCRHLLQLKRLEVGYCEYMEVIIYDDNGEGVQVKGEEDNNLILPRLEHLSLESLPSLRSFSGRDSLVVCLPALEKLDVLGCMNLKRLPLTTDSVSNLKGFAVSPGWFEGLVWEDQSLKSHLETLLH